MKVNECVSINITRDDNISSNICASCIHYVTQWEIFRNMCHKSNEVLIKATIKDIEEISTKDEDIEIESPLSDTAVIYKDKSDSDSEEEYLESEFIEFSIKEDLITTENVYQCHICFIEFDNCFQYLDHQITHNGEPVFQCDKCSDVYATREQLVEHDKNHRTPCPHCGKLILKSSMNLHLVKHSDRFRCTQCGGRFNSNAALAQHTITVHTDIKDHICEVCGKRFSSQTAMRVHMKSHSDERLYPCKLCDYAGRTASAIYVHMSTHANDMCVCEVCSKTFKSNRNLNDHLRRVHTKEKKHTCSYCDKKFVDRYMLSVHIRCHTGVRPYQCNFCKKSFIRSDGLKEHIAIHGQRIMHDCKLCGKKFTSKRGLTRHSCISVA
ncbi:gastrula zinc finger protein XlCGF52.1-like isoform X2 [Photinus pyralis]|nr:gastrula zinc finger protein XlCGF52.1-like isoform X2 [Photinus pyralis]